MGRSRLPFLAAVTVLSLSVTIVTSQDENQGSAVKPNAQQIEKLCKDRPEEEYFRLTTEGDCRDVVRCDKAGLTGAIRLAGVKCPNGLAFDIYKQTCDWKGRVNNCDKLESMFFNHHYRLMPCITCHERIIIGCLLLCLLYFTYSRVRNLTYASCQKIIAH